MRGRLPNRSRLNRLPRNIWVLTAASFLTDISSEMLFNLLPLFLFSVLGARLSYIGLIEGLSAAATSLVQIISGRISDRQLRRKPFVVIGYAVSALAKPLFIFATTWGGVLGIRFMERVGKGFRTPPRDALLSESLDARDRGFGFGIHRAGDTLGAVAGIALSLLIVLWAQPGQMELQHETFNLIILISVIPALMGVIILAIGVREVRGRAAPETRKSRDERRSAPVLEKRYSAFIVIVLLFSLGNSSDAFLIIRASSAGLSPTGILGMMLVFNLAYSLISAPAGAISDRLGRRRILSLGWIIFGLAYLGFAFISSGWQAWILIIIYGAYYGMTEGVAKAFVADLTPLPLRGRAYAGFSAAIGLMAFPASLMAGILWQGLGSWPGLGRAAPFLFGAMLAFLSAGLLMASPMLGTTTDIE